MRVEGWGSRVEGSRFPVLSPTYSRSEGFQLCLSQIDRLFSSSHTVSAVHIDQFWSRNENGLIELVSPNRLRHSYRGTSLIINRPPPRTTIGP